MPNAVSAYPYSYSTMPLHLEQRVDRAVGIKLFPRTLTGGSEYNCTSRRCKFSITLTPLGDDFEEGPLPHTCGRGIVLGGTEPGTSRVWQSAPDVYTLATRGALRGSKKYTLSTLVREWALSLLPRDKPRHEVDKADVKAAAGTVVDVMRAYVPELDSDKTISLGLK